MDLNHLYLHQQVSRFNADNAACDDAARIDPAFIDGVRDGDAASLVRVQLALERQTMQWLPPRSAA